MLALHHIKEDGDGGFPQLWLRNQRDLKNGPHHGRDELHFVGACGTANITTGEISEQKQ